MVITPPQGPFNSLAILHAYLGHFLQRASPARQSDCVPLLTIINPYIILVLIVLTIFRSIFHQQYSKNTAIKLKKMNILQEAAKQSKKN